MLNRIIVLFIQHLIRLLAQKRNLTLLTLGVLAIILFFGLRPKTWPNINHAEWSPDTQGLMFHAPGFAYVDDLHTLHDRASDQSFSICLAVSSAKQLPGFRPILMFHNGSDESQLTIAQWETSIIVMNGNDYSYRLKLPRISSGDILLDGKPRYLGITTGDVGTQLFDNGTLIAEKKGLRLDIPTNEKKLRLILGNSPYGNHSWEGTLHYLAIYDKQLAPEEMAASCQLNDGIDRKNPLLLFTFLEGKGTEVQDQSGNDQPLLLPSRPMALKQTFLAPPWPNFTLSKTLLADIIINFLGFIPLGAALYARLRLSEAFSRWYPARATMIISFWISLSIEMAQGWLPNRSSTLLDLVLNTLGAILGVLVIKMSWNTMENMLSHANSATDLAK